MAPVRSTTQIIRGALERLKRPKHPRHRRRSLLSARNRFREAAHFTPKFMEFSEQWPQSVVVGGGGTVLLMMDISMLLWVGVIFGKIVTNKKSHR